MADEEDKGWPEVQKHIWRCVSVPNLFSAYRFDQLALARLIPDGMKYVEEEVSRQIPADHNHVFGATVQEKGMLVIHECPGKQALVDIVMLFLKTGEVGIK